MLALQGAQVQYLVRELSSHMPHHGHKGKIRKKKLQKINKLYVIICCVPKGLWGFVCAVTSLFRTEPGTQQTPDKYLLNEKNQEASIK